MRPFAPQPKSVASLPWDARVVTRLPGDADRRNFPRTVDGALFTETLPEPVEAPSLVAWSDRLAADLGIAKPADTASLEVLAGNRVLPGMRPYAARYGGHQFGHWAGQLGDGRAITLGEVGPYELQLKGAGPTPYSRRGDGRAVLRSSVREFLCSEAMHFLGVPTTRALSLVATGEAVVRDMFYDGHPQEEPGAVVCRVAPTFLRFGNFEILTRSGELALLKTLADDTMREHFPELAPGDYGAWLDEIARRTAEMVVEWTRVGFVHGVMNTDNMSILGLTIDYGPYGWLEPYDPDWTPNTTDAQGRRYRFGNQPGIALWNLTRFAEALQPLIPDEARLRVGLDVYRETFRTLCGTMMAAKLGLPPEAADQDPKLLDDALTLLQATETDYTIFFRALCDWRMGDPAERFRELVARASYTGVVDPGWSAWAKRYDALLVADGMPDEQRSAAMRRFNPKYVLRNYLAQNAINAAAAGDTSGIERLLRVLEKPYDEHPGEEDLAEKRPEWARNAPGCSALSCSS